MKKKKIIKITSHTKLGCLSKSEILAFFCFYCSMENSRITQFREFLKGFW
jgi:hypothetical protein